MALTFIHLDLPESSRCTNGAYEERSYSNRTLEIEETILYKIQKNPKLARGMLTMS